MKKIYDILNDVKTEIKSYEIEEMTDIEKKKLKNKMFNNIRKTSDKRRKMIASIVGVIIVVGALGGSLYAYDKLHMNDIYKEKAEDYDVNEHYDKVLMETVYDGEVVIDTNYEESPIEFEVLMAAKGEHSIIYSILVTHNYDMSEGKIGLDIDTQVPDEVKDTEGDHLLGTGWGGGAEDTDALEENQDIYNFTIAFNENSDISEIDRLTIQVNPLEFLLDEYGMAITSYNYIDTSKYWTITFPITQEYNDFLYDIENISIPDENYILDKICIEPSGISLLFKTRFIGFPSEKFDINVEFADGSKMTGIEYNSSRADNTYIAEVYHSFNALVDVEDIVAIEIDGQLIELK